MTMSENFCPSCGTSTRRHILTWIEEIVSHLVPPTPLSRRGETWLRGIVETILVLTGIAEYKDDFREADIEPRSWYFIKEAEGRGVHVYALYGPGGFTNNFKAVRDGTTVRFDMLPVADFANGKNARATDDKKKTKALLMRHDFPVAHGKTFWFWQTKKALNFGKRVGFPLVVKPRNGSVSRHVTTNIKNERDLEQAIRYATLYSPSFIIEKFVTGSMYRGTVIDFKFVACIEQIPAHIVGGGTETIRMLIDAKNADPRRGGLDAPHATTHRIVENETAMNMLAEKHYTAETVLKSGERLFLQKDPFLKWGGDLKEVTSVVHPDNVKLFEEVARRFEIHAVGIDCIMPDISRSWKEQTCAILELNNMPAIDLHHVPTEGTPADPAQALVDMFFKYYLT
ncbi:hypothetical protein A2841_00750 [Candidatus Kaiserbacteria bacterium RIFCSPHIGHO2_01_FULL_48_10]|uniref:ATP-grasp domain-containing protein n=1 Tax=Candidatus Kaiserbacteria bacterium RIFCSPHIGHO2_01_FULL_48_10 TaxID=1798476 RepID=A0A1F6C688_9BACT|nr:MAG: hypothetical protein A2841_00750 [Candidatus Kaiserbacteria bacterium RIFCSPHIGHO2_01_FULL_48_10]